MKYLVLLAAVISMSSCNTCIGIGRDTEQAYTWTKEKIQGMGSGGGGGGSTNSGGAPVY